MELVLIVKVEVCEYNWKTLDLLYYIEDEVEEKGREPMEVVKELIRKKKGEQADLMRKVLK